MKSVVFALALIGACAAHMIIFNPPGARDDGDIGQTTPAGGNTVKCNTGDNTNIGVRIPVPVPFENFINVTVVVSHANATSGGVLRTLLGLDLAEPTTPFADDVEVGTESGVNYGIFVSVPGTVGLANWTIQVGYLTADPTASNYYQCIDITTIPSEAPAPAPGPSPAPAPGPSPAPAPGPSPAPAPAPTPAPGPSPAPAPTPAPGPAPSPAGVTTRAAPAPAPRPSPSPASTSTSTSSDAVAVASSAAAVVAAVAVLLA